MAKKLEMTTQEAAERWGVSVSAVIKWCRQGRVQHRYFGRALVITQAVKPKLVAPGTLKKAS